VAVFNPSVRALLTGMIEAFLLTSALSAVSLANGIRGADFTEVPRPRMIRTRWAIINLILCFLAAVAILAPHIYFLATRIIPFVALQPIIDLYQAVAISAGLALVIGLASYRIALKNIRDLLIKAEL